MLTNVKINEETTAELGDNLQVAFDKLDDEIILIGLTLIQIQRKMKLNKDANKQ